jgi:hypothetical protein
MKVSSKVVGSGFMGRVLLGVFCISALSGCGKGGFHLVQDVKLATFTQDDGSYVQLKALLNTGNLDFGITLPIIDPRNPSEHYGTIGLTPAITSSGTELTLAVNISKAKFVTGVDGRYLPNGTPIPVGGIDQSSVIGLRAGSRSEVYVGLGGGAAMLGVAVAITQFDQLAHYVPGVDIFPSFNINQKIQGVGGVFTGATPGTSGVALFVNAKSIMDSDGNVVDPAQDPEMHGQSLLSVNSVEVDPLYFRTPEVSARAQRRVETELYKLHRRHAHMTAQ